MYQGRLGGQEERYHLFLQVVALFYSRQARVTSLTQIGCLLNCDLITFRVPYKWKHSWNSGSQLMSGYLSRELHIPLNGQRWVFDGKPWIINWKLMLRCPMLRSSCASGCHPELSSEVSNPAELMEMKSLISKMVINPLLCVFTNH